MLFHCVGTSQSPALKYLLLLGQKKKIMCVYSHMTDPHFIAATLTFLLAIF